LSIRSKHKEAAFDVLVIGGGMTGICAAIASARQGAKTALVHDRPVLGGNASSEIRMHICGASTNSTKENLEETGILQEIMLENKYRNDFYNYSLWDAVLLHAVKSEPNLTSFLNTAMHDARMDGDRIRTILCYQHTTEINWELDAKIFVDCTGNGTLGFLAGAEFRTGSEGKAEFHEPHAPEEPNRHRMGNSLLFKAIDRGAPVAFQTPPWAYHFTEEQLKFRMHADSQPLFGISDSAQGVTIIGKAGAKAGEKEFDAYCLDYGYWWIELPGDGDDIIEEYEGIRDQLVGCVYGIWDHIKNGGNHGAANFDLLWVGMLPGMRESRRLVGDYILTENDILSNRIFPDAAAYGGWPIDNHTPKGLLDFDKLPSFIHNVPGAYTIPYRCYYSKNVGNLMIAGRILSASKLAMSSARVMGTCSVGGQAAGTAAGMCIHHGCDPRGIGDHIKELQQRLLKDDCHIPGCRNEDPADLARSASVTASSRKPGRECAHVINGFTRAADGEANLWESDGIARGGETIALALKEPAQVAQVRLTFDPNLSRPLKITLSSKRMKQQQRGAPAELVKDYEVVLWKDGKPVGARKVEGNYRRRNVLDFEPTECDRITVNVTAANGIPNARIFEIRIYSSSKGGIGQ
jgi:hypothetical protein